ncbi:hypothetical protein [Auraticoccus monumenti]|uniref:Uncharacterized protein n=1 Tax=Auraticoccus monumenti TaxID=675864 RepID=A0A1G7BNH3_9ACTN|nr:hypothetical protein [Auraticoccus monumenti]SDE28678.1 hypothetical protein SAMN04489747_3018 [Auraticoccus monumenti]
MSAQGPGPAPPPQGQPSHEVPGVANGWSAPRAESSPGSTRPGDPSVWAPPGTPPPPPPPPDRRALVVTVVLAVLVTLAGLGALGWWLATADRDAGTTTPPTVGDGWTPPPALELLTALDAAALDCVVEVDEPEQHVCFALEPEDWAEVHWQVGDGAVAGVSATVDHSAGDGSVAARVLAAVALGLDLPDADLTALSGALEEASGAEEGGDPVRVGTAWGAFELRPAGAGWVDVLGKSHDTPTRTHAGKDLGVDLDEATGVAEELGYRCGPLEEDAAGRYGYVACESGRDQVHLTTADDRLVALQVSDPTAHADVVSALLAPVPSAERAVLEQLHQSTGDQPSVRARAGWVALHDGGWLWLGAGSW